MSPSRGPLRLFRATLKYSQLQNCRLFCSLAENVTGSRIQSYTSRSSDPYLNLSIEHYLLQKSPPDSAILFLYTNRPCIVIGRNQNPWVEVNLGLLDAATGTRDTATDSTKPPALGSVDLVRRRSGGGTVFHDRGNVNWTVISPRDGFTRDKHAEMVVRALRGLGIDRARVNERHDIVLDQGQRSRKAGLSDDEHTTPYMANGSAAPQPLKVSGSAYKLTRTRALHHATCLLQSPNLNLIPDYLHSPAKPYIEARGVASVSSPVGNIGIEITPFERAVFEEFVALYDKEQSQKDMEEVGVDSLEISDIRKGYDELKTLDWMYAQTPQFTISKEFGNDVFSMTVRHGSVLESTHLSIEMPKLHEIKDWRRYASTDIGNWLNNILLIPSNS
ncbi:hypothetical protein BDY21DRAFT_278086 [Lineolata rhizophorae]|uniref:Putative lipoate-protein ligase A n=1 Tax=Lineolata rhizophorae TaxID=578093 RepID=A0A6A6PBM7_9PEZI|nr:hypothetical protein BDY21DRAFT_278086 [Lineolata rhizophorae]